MLKNKKQKLPGDLSKSQKIERMIRVNHAGEYGAKRIYEGQIAVTKSPKSKAIFKEMLLHEKEHLDFFENEIINRNVRPTIFQPIWHIAGFALGATTALFGHKTAMACTVAVEEVIDEHYKSQLEDLKSSEDLDKNELCIMSKIEKFRKDEINHKNIGLKAGAKKIYGYDLISNSIKTGSKVAIWLSKRF